MSPAPEREDLGALGCTRDGYQLVGVGMLIAAVFGSLSNLPMTLVVVYGGSWWYWTICELAVLAGAGLAVVGIAALAAHPYGPLPRALKIVVAWALVAGVLGTWVLDNRPLQAEGSNEYARQLGVALQRGAAATRWLVPLALVLFAGSSALFARRRAVPLAACLYAFVVAWFLSQWMLPDSDLLFLSGSALSALASFLAPLYLARRLRLSIRAAAEGAA